MQGVVCYPVSPQTVQTVQHSEACGISYRKVKLYMKEISEKNVFHICKPSAECLRQSQSLRWLRKVIHKHSSTSRRVGMTHRAIENMRCTFVLHTFNYQVAVLLYISVVGPSGGRCSMPRRL